MGVSTRTSGSPLAPQGPGDQARPEVQRTVQLQNPLWVPDTEAGIGPGLWIPLSGLSPD